MFYFSFIFSTHTHPFKTVVFHSRCWGRFDQRKGIRNIRKFCRYIRTCSCYRYILSTNNIMNQSLIEQIHRINLGGSFDKTIRPANVRPLQNFLRQHRQNVIGRFIARPRKKIIAPPLQDFIGGRRPPPPPATVPHFRIGRVCFFTRQSERPNETGIHHVGRLRVYDVATMTPLQPGR